MTKAKKFIPEGFNTVTPYLVVDGAEGLIEFIIKGLGGEQKFIMRGPDNKVTHATMKVGNSTIMLADTMRDTSPQTAMLYLYVQDADAAYKKATEAGGESVREPRDEFYGDRSGCVKDRWGNTWWFATQKEEVGETELKRRAEEMYRKERQEQPVH